MRLTLTKTNEVEHRTLAKDSDLWFWTGDTPHFQKWGIRFLPGFGIHKAHINHTCKVDRCE